jgi:hypothetical protein
MSEIEEEDTLSIFSVGFKGSIAELEKTVSRLKNLLQRELEDVRGEVRALKAENREQKETIAKFNTDLDNAYTFLGEVKVVNAQLSAEVQLLKQQVNVPRQSNSQGWFS